MNGMIVSIICPLYKGGKYVNNIMKKSIRNVCKFEMPILW